jgi:3'-5' exoribonuclease
MELKKVSGDRPVSGQYMIIENQLRIAKNGSSYLTMKIGDHTGEVAVKVWDADEELFSRLEAGKVIAIHNIQPKIYKDQIQLEWDAKNNGAFKLVPEPEVDFSLFLPQSPGNLTNCWSFIMETIAGIQDKLLREVLNSFFEDPDFKARFIKFPAALKRHHAYIGGLLEHTAGVTALCKAAAGYYPPVNRDLLLTGAVLHDIGKVKTYKIDKSFEGTNEGKLIGHLILGVEMVQRALDKMNDNSKGYWNTRNSLLHLLISHHGIMEWGSPVEPLTIEACILHHADNMDAQVMKFLTIIRNDERGQEWAPYDPGLGRSIFLGNLTPENRNLSGKEDDN